MDKAKCYESKPVKMIADTLDRLAKEVSRERQAAGYPEQCGKICYSNTVRQLATEACEHGFSPSVIARAARVTTQTVHNWCKQKPQQPLFRELRILPTQIPEQEFTTLAEMREPPIPPTRSLEFILPSGVRVLVNRQDLDANLLGLFISTNGA